MISVQLLSPSQSYKNITDFVKIRLSYEFIIYTKDFFFLFFLQNHAVNRAGARGVVSNNKRVGAGRQRRKVRRSAARTGDNSIRVDRRCGGRGPLSASSPEPEPAHRKPRTGKPDAGNPPVRFGREGGASPLLLSSSLNTHGEFISQTGGGHWPHRAAGLIRRLAQHRHVGDESVFLSVSLRLSLRQLHCPRLCPTYFRSIMG